MQLHTQWQNNKITSNQYFNASYANYIQSIERNINLDTNYWTFKSEPQYMSMVTNVTKYVGDRYLDELTSRYSDVFTENKKYIIEICNENDTIGRPSTNEFNNFTSCEATNLRYILHSFLILDYMKKENMNDIDIIEIGGGYGGLCYFLNKMCSLFDITIKSYSIFDLKLASQLQEKFG